MLHPAGTTLVGEGGVFDCDALEALVIPGDDGAEGSGEGSGGEVFYSEITGYGALADRGGDGGAEAFHCNVLYQDVFHGAGGRAPCAGFKRNAKEHIAAPGVSAGAVWVYAWPVE